MDAPFVTKDLKQQNRLRGRECGNEGARETDGGRMIKKLGEEAPGGEKNMVDRYSNEQRWV